MIGERRCKNQGGIDEQQLLGCGKGHGGGGGQVRRRRLRRAALCTPALSRLAFFAFDLLHLDGTDLRKRALVERRAKLHSIIEPGCFEVRYSELSRATVTPSSLPR